MQYSRCGKRMEKHGKTGLYVMVFIDLRENCQGMKDNAGLTGSVSQETSTPNKMGKVA